MSIRCKGRPKTAKVQRSRRSFRTGAYSLALDPRSKNKCTGHPNWSRLAQTTGEYALFRKDGLCEGVATMLGHEDRRLWPMLLWIPSCQAWRPGA
jgi:hypothetical protein